MSSDELKKWQAKKITEGLFPGANYLFRLRERMEKAGFPSTDPLYVEVCKAYDAMHDLRVAVNYLSCTGVGNLPRE
jgi:hypothetical protein